ncbi:hypothetical protein [Brevibacillus choshinensis]|uniref:hypothetical protein n=1 Tax=Brevibacillus choshinensis TaxID=54911 RepID=UPI002E21F01D|nr:hypothetical protein [Brevibacillus choshinensis]
MSRLDSLFQYMDRLIELKKLNVNVEQDINDCILSIRKELELSDKKDTRDEQQLFNPFVRKRES